MKNFFSSLKSPCKFNAGLPVNISPRSNFGKLNETWKKRTCSLDRLCKDFPVSRFLPLLAALDLFGVRMTIDDIAVITGLPNVDHFPVTTLVSEIPGLAMKNEGFAFLGSTENKARDLNDAGVDINDVLKTILGLPLPRKIVISFEKRVLSLKYYYNQNVVPGFDLSDVLNTFGSNQSYVEILIEEERIHSLLLSEALVGVSALDKNNPSYSCKASLMFSDAFSKVVRLITEDKRYLNTVWIKYLYQAAGFTDEIPESLLNYVDTSSYRSATALLQDHINNGKRKQESALRRERFTLYTEMVLSKILHEIDECDIPGAMLLASIQMGRGEYDASRITYHHILDANTGTDFNVMTATIASYEREIKYLCDAKYKTCDKELASQYAAKINSINRTLDQFFGEFEHTIKTRIEESNENDRRKLKRQYVSLVTNHARQEKKQGHFRACYELLSSIPTDYPSQYRVFTEYGFLYQCQGSGRNQNPFYSLTEAAKMFHQAYYELNTQDLDQANKVSRKSVLIPLANTYYADKKYAEAKSICMMVLQIDSTEKNASSLLRRIKQMPEVSCA